MGIFDKQKSYVAALSEPEKSQAIVNSVVLASSIGLDRLVVEAGVPSGFHMVAGLSEAYINPDAASGKYFDHTRIFGFGRAKDIARRIEKFRSVSEKSFVSISEDLFGNPFYLKDGDKTIAAGFSASIKSRLLGSENIALIAVQDTLHLMANLCFDDFGEKYTTLVLPPSQSLYYPGKTVSFMFFKHEWIIQRTLTNNHFGEKETQNNIQSAVSADVAELGLSGLVNPGRVSRLLH